METTAFGAVILHIQTTHLYFHIHCLKHVKCDVCKKFYHCELLVGNLTCSAEAEVTECISTESCCSLSELLVRFYAKNATLQRERELIPIVPTSKLLTAYVPSLSLSYSSTKVLDGAATTAKCVACISACDCDGNMYCSRQPGTHTSHYINIYIHHILHIRYILYNTIMQLTLSQETSLVRV